MHYFLRTTRLTIILGLNENYIPLPSEIQIIDKQIGNQFYVRDFISTIKWTVTTS